MACSACPLTWLLPVAVVGFAGVLVSKVVSPAAGPEAAAVTPAADQPTEKKEQPKKDGTGADAEDPAYVLGFKMNRIDGTSEDLSIYKGKVVVFVNVASKCGYTGQYKALEALYEAHKDKGLVILGFPANNFREQEPGENAEIAAFCSATYGVTFPMFEKISVKGEDQHPLYKKLTAQPEPIGGDPKWNFTKFVVNREGRVVARFDAKGDGKDRSNLEPALVKKVEELLGVKHEDAKKPPAKQAPAGS